MFRDEVRIAYLERKYMPNRITYILANTTFFIEDLMAAHKLVPTLQNIRFLEDWRQKSRNIDQGLLNTPAMTTAPPVHKSHSPWTTLPDMHNQGIPQQQQTMLMQPLAEDYATCTTL